MGVMTEDGNKEAGGKDFLDPVSAKATTKLHHGLSPPLQYQVLRSNIGPCTWGRVHSTNLSTMKPVRSCTWGAQPHQPAVRQPQSNHCLSRNGPSRR